MGKTKETGRDEGERERDRGGSERGETEREIKKRGRAEIRSEKERYLETVGGERRTTIGLTRGDEREIRSFSFLFLPFYSTNQRPVTA